MVEIKNDSELGFVCGICDFGFSNIIGSGRSLASGLIRPTEIGVSVRYAAPEVILQLIQNNNTSSLSRRCEGDKKIDIYAYSMILFDCVVGKEAWKDMSYTEIATAVVNGRRPTFPTDEDKSDISMTRYRKQFMESMIISCWNQSAVLRPMAKDILDSLLSYSV